MKDVTLNQREQARLQVLNSVLEFQLPRPEAAELMGISERQLRRTLAAYRKEGAAALSHGNRGRQPRNTVKAKAQGPRPTSYSMATSAMRSEMPITDSQSLA